MTQFAYFVTSNLIASISTGIVLVIVPWKLVSSVDGQTLIYINIFSMSLLLVFRNRIYELLRAVQARQVMAACMTITAITLFSLIVSGGIISLICSMIVVLIYIYFYYLTRSIITKGIAPTEKYGRYNGILEMENQASAFIAGGIAVYLLDIGGDNFRTIIVVSIVGFFVSSTILLVKIRDNPVDDEIVTQAKSRTSFKNRLSFIVIGANATFICIKLLDVVNPIYVVDTLKEGADVIALSTIFYTVGALCAGLIGATQIMRAREMHVIFISLVGCFLFYLFTALVSSIEAFYASWVAWGLFNGLSRVAWQTIVMTSLHGNAMAEFFAGISLAVSVLRIGFLLVYSVFISSFEPHHSFLYLAVICLAGVSVFVAGATRKTASSC